MQVLGLVISHIYTHTHPHLQAFFLSASRFVLSIWNHHRSQLPDSEGSVYELMAGIKFSGIQFHFSLYCRLVIELIDSSRQHPLSSLWQFYRDGWQTSQFCSVFKCAVSFSFWSEAFLSTPTHHYITYKQNKVWQILSVKNLIWVSLTSLNTMLFLKLCMWESECRTAALGSVISCHLMSTLSKATQNFKWIYF